MVVVVLGKIRETAWEQDQCDGRSCTHARCPHGLLYSMV